MEYFGFGIEGVEVRYLNGQDRVFLYVLDNVSVKICFLKKEILNEQIVNFEILVFFFFLDKIVFVVRMGFL